MRWARRNRRLGGEFGKLWTASTVSSLGDGVTLIAGPLLAASLTRDPVRVGGLMLAQQLPAMLLALPTGAAVDRTDRRRLMSTVCLVRAIGLGVLGLTIALGHPSLPLLYAIFFLLGCAGIVFDNASTTVLPALVRHDQLELANGRLLAAKTLGQSLLAAPLGGWLFALAAWTPFLLDAGALALVAALVAALPAATAPPNRPHTTVRAAVTEGVRWLLGHRLLRTLALTVGLSNLTLAGTTSILVLVAHERLGLGSVGYGLLLATLAVGGVIGGLVADRVVATIGPGTALRAELIVEALTHLGLALTRDAIAAGVMLAVFGLHLMVFSTICASLRQTLVPPQLLGRVHSAYRLVTNAGMFLGAALGGVLAKYLGLAAPFWLGAVNIALLTVCVWRVLNNHDIQTARQAATMAR